MTAAGGQEPCQPYHSTTGGIPPARLYDILGRLSPDQMNAMLCGVAGADPALFEQLLRLYG